MIVQIGCADGHTYTSDKIDEVELQASLDEVDGYIFDGNLSHKRCENIDDFILWMDDMMTYNSSNNKQFVSITIDKHERTFNVQHIIWFSIVKDADR